MDALCTGDESISRTWDDVVCGPTRQVPATVRKGTNRRSARWAQNHWPFGAAVVVGGRCVVPDETYVGSG